MRGALLGCGPDGETDAVRMQRRLTSRTIGGVQPIGNSGYQGMRDICSSSIGRP